MSGEAALPDHAPAAPEAGVEAGPAPQLALPQAVGGALWANPTVFPTIPVQVAATSS